MPGTRDYQTEAIYYQENQNWARPTGFSRCIPPVWEKFKAVAKGVRRPKSKLSGHLELLTHSQVTLAKGHNLDTVTGSQTINRFMPLKQICG